MEVSTFDLDSVAVLWDCEGDVIACLDRGLLFRLMYYAWFATVLIRILGLRLVR